MKPIVWPVAALIGIIDATLLYGFESLGIDGTNWLWNTLLPTESERWLVVPVALILGLAFTAVLTITKATRVIPPQNDLMSELQAPPNTLDALWKVLAVGAASLLAGAALGPEQALMTASAIIGAYLALRFKQNKTAQLLVLASVGALLVAFVDSFLLAVIPMLLLIQNARQQKQRVKVVPFLVILVAGALSFLTTELIDRITDSTTTPTVTLPALEAKDYVVALALGFIAGLLAWLMNQLIDWVYDFSRWLEKHRGFRNIWVFSLVGSAGIALSYLLGGRTVEFSGSIGSQLLAADGPKYGVWALAGLIVAKLLAIAWSKGTGYRGGLVFPSIYMGLALGLLTGAIWPDLAGSGAIIGGIAGMITSGLGSPIIAAIFVISILPLKLILVAACAIAGSTLSHYIQQQFAHKTAV